jgi:hypothetical protein
MPEVVVTEPARRADGQYGFVDETGHVFFFQNSDEGWDRRLLPATAREIRLHEAEVTERRLLEQSVPLALREKFARSASLGLIPGEGSEAEQAQRGRYLEEEHPWLSFVAEAGGGLAMGLGLAAAGAGLGAAGLAAGGVEIAEGLGLAGRAARATGAGLEFAGRAAVEGISAEQERSFVAEDQFNPGHAFMYGVAGEVISGAAALGLRKARDLLRPRAAVPEIADATVDAPPVARAAAVESPLEQPSIAPVARAEEPVPIAPAVEAPTPVAPPPAAVEEDVPLTPKQQLIVDMQKVMATRPPGALLAVQEVRPISPLSKEDFDKAAMELQDDMVLSLHHHDHAKALTPEARAELIRAPNDTHYVGMAFRRSAKPDELLPKKRVAPVPVAPMPAPTAPSPAAVALPAPPPPRLEPVPTPVAQALPVEATPSVAPLEPPPIDELPDRLFRARERALNISPEDALKPHPDELARDVALTRESTAREIQGTRAIKIAKDMDSISDTLDTYTDPEFNAERIKGLVSGPSRAQKEWWAQLVTESSELIASVQEFRQFPEVVKHVNALERALERRMTNDYEGGARTMQRAISVKRILQRLVDYANDSSRKALDRNAIISFSEAVEAVQEPLRLGLERVDLWGRAGDWQRQVNKAMHEEVFKARRMAVNKLSEITETNTYTHKGPGFRIRFDPGKIERNLIQADDPDGMLPREFFERYLSGIENLNKANRAFGVEPERVLGKVDRELASIRKALSEGTEVTKAKARMRVREEEAGVVRERQSRAKAEEAEAQGRQRAIAGIATTAGYALGGPVGAAVGLGATYLRHAMSLRKSMSTIAGGARPRQARAARALATGAPAIKNKFRLPAGTAVSHAMSLFVGDHSGPREAFAKHRDEIALLNTEPEHLAETVGSSFGAMPLVYPETFTKMGARYWRALDYLQTHYPAAKSMSVANPRGIAVSDTEVEEAAELWQAVIHPDTMYEAIEAKEATLAQMQALRAVHPDVHDDLLLATLEEIAMTEEPPDDRTAIWIDAMFGLDGACGPSYSWRCADAIGAAKARELERRTSTRPKGLPSAAASQPAGIRAIRTGPTSA